MARMDAERRECIGGMRRGGFQTAVGRTGGTPTGGPGGRPAGHTGARPIAIGHLPSCVRIAASLASPMPETASSSSIEPNGPCWSR